MSASRGGWPLDPGSDGTIACLLITGDHSVMMVEFDDGRQPVNNFLAKALKERWIPWSWMFRAQPHEGVDRKPFEGLARRPGMMRWQG